MDLEGSTLNHLRAAFFNLIGKALQVTGSEALTRVILDLKAFICFWGSALPS